MPENPEGTAAAAKTDADAAKAAVAATGSGQATSPQADAEPTAEKYTREGWAERARTRLGISPHVVRGALHELEADAEVVEADVRKALDAFSKPKEQAQ